MTALAMGRADLAQWFALLGYTVGVEVGTAQGLYAAVLCQANPDLSLTCVDPWVPQPGYQHHADPAKQERHRALAADRLAPYGVTLVRATSADAATLVGDASVDFVYLDGDHRYDSVRADLAAWRPKVRPGGMLCGHDYKDHPQGSQIEVKQAVDQWVAETGETLFVCDLDRSPSWGVVL